jgi:hypothetical protein
MGNGKWFRDFPFVISHLRFCHLPSPREFTAANAIIINDAAARARRAWPIIRARLDESGIAYDVQQTERPPTPPRGCELPSNEAST